MSSPKLLGRLAGGLYLLSAIAAGVPILYVSGTLIVDGNASATSHNILANEFLFRASLVSELVGALLLVAVVLLLRRLLRATSEGLAQLMVTLVLLSVPISGVNLLTEAAALDLAQGSAALAALSQAQRDALAWLCLNLHAEGTSLANIFWGLWLLPLGRLIVRSNALPRFLGVWLIADGCALVTVSLTSLLLPSWSEVVNKAAIPAELGELVAMLWLLARGARAHAPAH